MNSSHVSPPSSPVYPRIGAVVLAAGAGIRLGSRPKSLLEIEGVPLIRKLVVALTSAGVAPIVIVLGHYADAIENVLHDLPVTRVRNPSPDDGQHTSLRIGLRALAGEVDAVMVALADQPAISAADIADLISAFNWRGDRSMLAPSVGGAPGNPVIVDAALADEWLTGDVNATGQRWRRDNPARVHWFDTPNHHYCIDIDTVEDIARFAALTGQTLCWPERAN